MLLKTVYQPKLRLWDGYKSKTGITDIIILNNPVTCVYQLSG